MEANERPDVGAALQSLLTDPEIDLRGAARAALGTAVIAGVLGGGLYILGKLADGYAARVADQRTQRNEEASQTEEPADVEQVDAEVIEAATLLDVDVDATADEIRAALRAKLGASCLHPDHGGDGTEARCLIDAKNLLIERIREVHQ